MRSIFFICSIIAVMLLLGACNQETKPAQYEPNTIHAKTIRLALTDAQECRSLPGQVESKNSVTLSSKLSGTIKEVMVEEGALVTKGQSLLRIDDAELRQREMSIKSTAGQANLERQALLARTAQAKATSDRMQKLLAMHAVSQDDADKAKADFEALANQAKAYAAQSAAAGYQGEELKSLMTYSTVTAPISGILTKRYADLGSFVNAGEPIVAIDDVKSGYDIVSLADESLLNHIREGMNVVAVIPAMGSAPFLTSLNSVIAHVDPTSRAFRVKAGINDTKGLSAGLFGKICVPVAKSEKLLVPISAIRQRGELSTALIVDGNGILRLRLLKMGARYQRAVLGGQTFILESRAENTPNAEELIEVLSGLHSGEVVVLDAPDTTREGDRLARS